MAFRGFELSRSKGSPVELYRFRYGVMEHEAHCYTNGEKPRSHLGLEFKPLPIKRGKLASSSEDQSRSTLEVTMPGGSELAEMFRVTAPAGTITLTVFQGHTRDPESQFLATWVGRITVCAWEDNGNQVKLICEHARTQLRRLALRRHYQYMCPHVLYGDQCRASEAAASQPRTAHAVDGRLVILTETLSNPQRYLGGMLKWIDSRGAQQARTILAVTNASGRTRLSLSGIATDLVAGSDVLSVLGCSHSLDENGCPLHNNTGNFGGQPYIPESNPLGATGAFS